MSIEAQLAAALRLFGDRFGRAPAAAASAPGRVNVIGEHTDYHGGFVLPMAIDRRTIVLAAPSDDAWTFVSTDADDPVTIDADAGLVPRPGHWSSYVTGVIDQLRRRGVAVPPVDLLVTSTLPTGAGLSSSAALGVGTATALAALAGVELPAVEIARIVQAAEDAFAGTPCGIMDPLVSAAGVAGHVLLIDCAAERFEPLPWLGTRSATLLVADTGVRHALADGAYADRRATSTAVAETLGLSSLRKATLAMLESPAIDDVARARAAHVVTENTRTLLAASALRDGDAETLGDLMFASHASLRDFYQVSAPELDAIVAVAERIREEGGGVLGARMTGGGFGGCAIVLCRPDAAATVSATIDDAFAASFSRPLPIFPVAPSAGARTWPVPAAPPDPVP